MTKSARLSEFDLIARYFAPMAGEGGLGLLDDAAILTPSPGHDLVLTQDALVEGVHFFETDAPAAIARKALRANLSDLAGKGAKPRGFLMSFARHGSQSEAWLADFAQGLAADSAFYACPLLGGDTVKARGAFFLSITALGEVPAGRMVRRQGGAAGDIVFVSGTIGDAALGLKARLDPTARWLAALSAGACDFILDRYLHPQPRLALRDALLAHASAAMDVSDGLVGDCDKLAHGLGCVMDVAAVPLSPAARVAIAAEPSLLKITLTGGDDYEILAAVPPHKAQAFAAAATAAGVPVSAIGTLTEHNSPLLWRDATGQAMAFSSRSFEHGAG